MRSLFAMLTLITFLLAPLEASFAAEGSKAPAQCYTRQDLSARSAGFIDKVHVNDGQVVRAGDLLAEMDHRLLATAVKEAEAAVAAAKAQLALAQDGQQRLKKIADSASEQEVVAAEIRVQQAKAQLNQAQAVLERNKIQLGDTYIKAEIDGRVSGLPRVKGLFVQAGHSLGRVEAATTVCAASN